MATRARRATPASRTRSKRATSSKTLNSFRLPPHVARSLFGLTLLIIGAVTLIALLFPQSGILNRYVDDVLRPAFGQGAFLLAALLIVAGVAIERPAQIGYGSTLAIVGGVIVFIAGLGLIHLVWGRGAGQGPLREGGGWLGNTLSSILSDFVSPIGAFVVLVGLLIGGLLMLFNVTLRGLFRPVTGGGRMLASAIATPARAIADSAATRRAETAATVAVPASSPPRGRIKIEPPSRPDLPVPEPSSAPLSQTVWSNPSSPAAPQRSPATPYFGAANTTPIVAPSSSALVRMNCCSLLCFETRP